MFVQDESRCGLQTIRRRRITARGVKPVGTLQQGYANCWVYGCIAPASGQHFFLLLPSLNADQMQIFLDEFAQAHPTTFNIMMMDNSGAHKAKQLRIPANISLVFQPPANPELNPPERVWQDLKSHLAWQIFDDLAALQDELVKLLGEYDADTLRSLTGYPYLLQAIQAISPCSGQSMSGV